MPIQSKLFDCRTSSEEERLELILQDLDGLSSLQKNILRERYIFILRDFTKRCKFYSKLYHIGHFLITVGSLIVPALMSIQYVDTGRNVVQDFQTIIYWITWILSLLVTTSNGIITLFKVDKKYFFLHTTQERLRSEGWQYFELTGRYSGQLIQYEILPSHSNQFIFFSHAVEKIKMRQIEEEYYKQEDIHSNSQQKGTAVVTAAQSSIVKQTDDLYTPSPQKPIEMINTIVPTAVQDAVNAIIKSNTGSVSLRGNLPNIHVHVDGADQKQEQTHIKKEEAGLSV